MTRFQTIVLFLVTLPLHAYGQNASSSAPTAQVTVYSSGSTFMVLPGSHGTFKGKIFDGDRTLALLKGHSFVTFKMPPGVHVLSANWWPTTGPAGGEHLTINLVADRHYYVSTAFEEVGLGGTRIIIKEVTCEDAQQPGLSTKPLDTKHLRPDGLAQAVDSKSFPKCE